MKKTPNSARRRAMLALYASFRKAWSPRASYHLVRARYGNDAFERFDSVVWLMANRISATGAAPCLGFKGHPFIAVAT